MKRILARREDNVLPFPVMNFGGNSPFPFEEKVSAPAGPHGEAEKRASKSGIVSLVREIRRLFVGFSSAPQRKVGVVMLLASKASWRRSPPKCCSAGWCGG